MERYSNEYSVSAEFSHREIVEGRARGNRRALWLRARIQTFLFKLGSFAQIHCVSVTMIGLVILIACTIGFYKAKLETSAETLWIEVGGRLEKELAYSKAVGSDSLGSYEMIIQTPNLQGSNVLTVSALQKHVEFVKKAMEVEVEVFQQTWGIHDLCSKPSVPHFHKYINKVLEQLLPCTVITPLDCFWDGAKIYTQNISILFNSIKWTNFSPVDLLNLLREKYGNKTFNMDEMNSMLNEAGISHGYMKKPCLDPIEAGCPLSAPNKASKKKPDIAAELTGGCKGFAENLMKWPEELIVGGVQKNTSGVIRSAEALQTVINLMTEQNLYKWWLDSNGYVSAKVNHIDWDVEKAKTVLQAWQRKFSEVVNGLSKTSDKQNVMAFSTTSFRDLLKQFSTANSGLIIGGYVLMLVYACFTMIRLNSIIESQGCMGILGVLLVSLSVAAGLGICSLLGISFNAASTQVLPFLALGLGVDDMFLLAHTFRDLNSRSLRSKELAGHCLSTTGVSIMLTSFSNAIAFFMAAFIPIPALRAFCIQAGVTVIFNLMSIVIIYPAMIAMDVKRRESQRYDIFCCVEKDSHSRVIPIRENTGSYGNSLVTVNQTSDENSYICQISTASASVSMGQSMGDAFILPGVELKASADCNFNQSIYNGLLGGDIMALPGMSNIVVSVSSEHNTEGGTSHYANADAKAHISNNRGSALNINTSSSANCSNTSMRSQRSEHASKHGMRSTASKVNRYCYAGSAPKDSNSRGSSNRKHSNIEGNTRKENNSSLNERGYSQSSANTPSHQSIDIESNQKGKNGSQLGKFQISANVVANTTQGEPSCSSNADVILRPDRVQSSSRQSYLCQSNSSKSVFDKKFAKISLGYLTKHYYAPLLQKVPIKILVLFLFAIMFSVTVFGIFQVKDGLDISDVVPKGTKTSDFLEARNKYFSFYDIAIVTKSNYNYPRGQEKLYRLHEAFVKVKNIVKSEDKSLPKFWLMYFRDWLKGLQQAFDSDWGRNSITHDGPFLNASANGKLAYKLLLQTGNPNDPYNKRQVGSLELVNKQGIINPKGFYNYLRAWYYMDPMGYEMSRAHIKPVPEFWKDEVDRNRIFPAKPIQYAEMSFYLTDLKDTADFVKTIKHVREICDRFSDLGLPNYPRGDPFTFWEQYIWLRRKLLVAVTVILATSFIVISAVLVNIWAGFIVVVVLAMTTIELYGFLGLAGIKLSVIPAVTLILSVGVGVEFTVHLCMAFLTSTGDRNQRVQEALETVLSPVVDGAISTILGVVMLAGSEFEFVVKYFFHVLAALIVIGFINGVVFLPVLLSLIGPNPEVIPLRENSMPANTTSWLGLIPFNRNRCSSVSNSTFDSRPRCLMECTTEMDDVQFQIMPTTESCPHDPKMMKGESNDPQRHQCRKKVDSTSENQAFSNPGQRSGSALMVKNTPSVTKLSATASFTVELQQQNSQMSQKSGTLVTRSSLPESDLELVDCEEEFV